MALRSWSVVISPFVYKTKLTLCESRWIMLDGMNARAANFERLLCSSLLSAAVGYSGRPRREKSCRQAWSSRSALSAALRNRYEQVLRVVLSDIPHYVCKYCRDLYVSHVLLTYCRADSSFRTSSRGLHSTLQCRSSTLHTLHLAPSNATLYALHIAPCAQPFQHSMSHFTLHACYLSAS